MKNTGPTESGIPYLEGLSCIIRINKTGSGLF